jgi:hypothetical protein
MVGESDFTSSVANTIGAAGREEGGGRREGGGR